MSIKLDDSFWNNTLANAVGTIIATLFIAILGRSLLNRLWQQIYKKVPRLVRILLLRFLDLVNLPIFWLVLFFIFQTMIFFDVFRSWSIVATSIIFLRFYRYSRSRVVLKQPITSQFSDGFHKLDDINKNWETITGKPSLDEGKGNPRPSLLLSMASPAQATNTFLLLKEIQAEKGEIECDIFLEPGAVLNIVFMCDKDKHNWHMARYETRTGSTDGLLIKDAGKGNNWRFNNMSTSRTNPGSWYRVKVEFSSERARMFRNGELIAEIIDPQIFGKYIGLFNECANVSVDNFKFSAG